MTDKPQTPDLTITLEKEKRVALELVDFKPLEHPVLLQYLAKLGIDHDIAR
jgi:hypothetical protein